MLVLLYFWEQGLAVKQKRSAFPQHLRDEGFHKTPGLWPHISLLEAMNSVEPDESRTDRNIPTLKLSESQIKPTGYIW